MGRVGGRGGNGTSAMVGRKSGAERAVGPTARVATALARSSLMGAHLKLEVTFNANELTAQQLDSHTAFVTFF